VIKCLLKENEQHIKYFKTQQAVKRKYVYIQISLGYIYTHAQRQNKQAKFVIYINV